MGFYCIPFKFLLFMVNHNIIAFHLTGRTRSVDITISNILEGVVTYIPQVESSSSGRVNAVAQQSKSIPLASASTHTLANTVQVIYRQELSLQDTEFLVLRASTSSNQCCSWQHF